MHPSPTSNRTTTPHSIVGNSPTGVDHHQVGVAVVLVSLRVYKLFVSPFYAGSCRFHPSCSSYMAEAVTQHGVVKGMALGVRRLLRCRPFGGHGFDPVPRV